MVKTAMRRAKVRRRMFERFRGMGVLPGVGGVILAISIMVKIEMVVYLRQNEK